MRKGKPNTLIKHKGTKFRILNQEDKETLYKKISLCELCSLHTTRITPVLPQHNRNSRVMVIAQSPGEVENRNGIMFTGPSGRLFYQLLGESGIQPGDIYLTNLIKCMLPGARRPHHDELATCPSYLEQEIMLLSPQVFVPLGFHATRWLLRRFRLPVPDKKSVKALFGLRVRKEKWLIYPLRHPTVLLFQPQMRSVMLRNYKQLHTIIKRLHSR